MIYMLEKESEKKISNSLELESELEREWKRNAERVYSLTLLHARTKNSHIK